MASRKKQYTKENLEKALDAINEGMSIYQASKTYILPKTLRDKRSHKYPD